MQELSIANNPPLLFRKTRRAVAWLWVTPISNTMFNETGAINIIAKYQTIVKKWHQNNLRGDIS